MGRDEISCSQPRSSWLSDLKSRALCFQSYYPQWTCVSLLSTALEVLKTSSLIFARSCHSQWWEPSQRMKSPLPPSVGQWLLCFSPVWSFFLCPSFWVTSHQPSQLRICVFPSKVSLTFISWPPHDRRIYSHLILSSSTPVWDEQLNHWWEKTRFKDDEND